MHAIIGRRILMLHANWLSIIKKDRIYIKNVYTFDHIDISYIPETLDLVPVETVMTYTYILSRLIIHIHQLIILLL
ncbi:hypothetical protein HZS_2946 [Henneguya salminicola]|nr:hypothetical protein HZS_2946 [Henneguya salminicola]